MNSEIYLQSAKKLVEILSLRVVVVVHGYTASAASEAERLKAMLNSKLGVEVELCTQEEVRESSCLISDRDIVYPLFLLRGSGYLEVVTKASSRGAKIVEPPSLKDAVGPLSEKLSGCRSVSLVHPEAERSETLREVARLLQEKLGVPVNLFKKCSGSEDCVAVLSLLPGITSLRASEECGDKLLVSHLLPLLEEAIVSRLKVYIEASGNL
ncbi:MAG: hypothetical protein QW617_06085 [Acidilobaceae archaeon]